MAIAAIWFKGRQAGFDPDIIFAPDRIVAGEGMDDEPIRRAGI
jgi:hypothetical protein